MQQFKAKLMAILEKTGYAEKRSSKLGLDDYLKMLFAFNQAGVHFRWFWNHNLIWFLYFFINLLLLALFLRLDSFLIVFKYFK